MALPEHPNREPIQNYREPSRLEVGDLSIQALYFPGQDGQPGRWNVDIYENGVSRGSCYAEASFMGVGPTGFSEFIHRQFPRLVPHLEQTIIPFLEEAEAEQVDA